MNEINLSRKTIEELNTLATTAVLKELFSYLRIEIDRKSIIIIERPKLDSPLDPPIVIRTQEELIEFQRQFEK